jgi:hypothetical protein
MSQEPKVLTKEVAEQFLATPFGVKLEMFTTLEDAAAQVLAGHQGELPLDGFAGLSELTESAGHLALARRLVADCGGRALLLNNLRRLSVGAAQELAKHDGLLGLGGLTDLPKGVALALTEHRFWLSLDGLTTLSDEAAQALAGHDGDLYLDSLTTLSDEAARALARHKGELHLEGLTTLSDEAAQAMSEHAGTVYMDALSRGAEQKPDPQAVEYRRLMGFRNERLFGKWLRGAGLE